MKIPDNDVLTRNFTLACVAVPPVLGSVSSFILHGGALWGLIGVYLGRLRLSRDRGMILTAVPIYLYCVFYVVSFACNPVAFSSWPYLLPLATLLLFPFLYSSWCVSRKESVAAYAAMGGVVGSFGALILAVWQFRVLGMRAEGGAGNAIVFAMVTCLAASTALAALFVPGRIPRPLLLAAVGAGTAAVLLSGSRTSWVALAACATVILLVNRRRQASGLSRRAAAAALLGLGVIAVVAAGTVSGRIAALAEDWRLLSSEQNYDTSLGRRVALWEIGGDLFTQRPLVGHGPQSTKRLITQHFREDYGLRINYTHFHSGFLTAAVQSGLPGVLSLAAIFLMAFLNAIRTFRRSDDAIERFGGAILVSVVATYVIGGMTGIVIGHDILDTSLMAFLCLGTFLATGIPAFDQTAADGGQSPLAGPLTGSVRARSATG